jgi:hypothetical protein
MKKQTIMEPTVPTANIAVNKSRIKLYNEENQIPSYFLQNGQEFQIEIFNPSQDVILTKITLNNRLISQGGLVLNPGQRVFLDRYFDVAKKFKFDTYEVANTSEVAKAIENNGDIKVEFFKEEIKRPLLWINNLESNPFGSNTIFNSFKGNNYDSNYTSDPITGPIMSNTYFHTSVGTLSLDNLSFNDEVKSAPIKKDFKNVLRSVKSKTIETGRVEEGSYSDQKFKTVNKDFENIAFHTIEYKLLPISQKINKIEDLNVKIYCTNCGTKLGKGHKFCSNCGTKA